MLWLLAERSIAARDVAEVLGSALALHLRFGTSVLIGVAVTAFDTLTVLGSSYEVSVTSSIFVTPR